MTRTPVTKHLAEELLKELGDGATIVGVARGEEHMAIMADLETGRVDATDRFKRLIEVIDMAEQGF